MDPNEVALSLFSPLSSLSLSWLTVWLNDWQGRGKKERERETGRVSEYEQEGKRDG